MPVFNDRLGRELTITICSTTAILRAFGCLPRAPTSCNSPNRQADRIGTAFSSDSSGGKADQSSRFGRCWCRNGDYRLALSTSQIQQYKYPHRFDGMESLTHTDAQATRGSPCTFAVDPIRRRPRLNAATTMPATSSRSASAAPGSELAQIYSAFSHVAGHPSGGYCDYITGSAKRPLFDLGPAPTDSPEPAGDDALAAGYQVRTEKRRVGAVSANICCHSRPMFNNPLRR